ncbi:hypothetical protein LCGC14_2395620, partial [marine sediment metagenome]
MTSRIEELIRGTNKADEPGAASLGEIIQKGDDVEKPEIGGLEIITSAGYTNVYD